MKTAHPIPFNLTIRDMNSRHVRIATEGERREFQAQRKILVKRVAERESCTPELHPVAPVYAGSNPAALSDPGDHFLALAFLMATASAYALGWMLCDIFSK